MVNAPDLSARPELRSVYGQNHLFDQLADKATRAVVFIFMDEIVQQYAGTLTVPSMATHERAARARLSNHSSQDAAPTVLPTPGTPPVSTISVITRSRSPSCLADTDSFGVKDASAADDHYFWGPSNLCRAESLNRRTN
jgi:hypothetical protein